MHLPRRCGACRIVATIHMCIDSSYTCVWTPYRPAWNVPRPRGLDCALLPIVQIAQPQVPVACEGAPIAIGRNQHTGGCVRWPGVTVRLHLDATPAPTCNQYTYVLFVDEHRPGQIRWEMATRTQVAWDRRGLDDRPRTRRVSAMKCVWCGELSPAARRPLNPAGRGCRQQRAPAAPPGSHRSSKRSNRPGGNR